MLKTNEKKLVKMTVQGHVANPGAIIKGEILITKSEILNNFNYRIFEIKNCCGNLCLGFCICLCHTSSVRHEKEFRTSNLVFGKFICL